MTNSKGSADSLCRYLSDSTSCPAAPMFVVLAAAGLRLLLLLMMLRLRLLMKLLLLLAAVRLLLYREYTLL